MGVGDNEHVALGASGKAGDHVKLEDSFETSCYEGTLAGTDRCCARQCSSTHSSTHDLEGMLRRDAELADVPREAETFWVPADATPVTSLEKMAKSIFDFHTKNLRRQQSPDASIRSNLAASADSATITHTSFVEKKRSRRAGDSDKVETDAGCSGAESGAEWWIQVREEGHHSNLGMPFHWDKDERLWERRGVVICPVVSTVTYLTDHGAPTVVLESRPTAKGEVIAGEIDRAFVSYPALFKHLAFNGSFLHGVPELMRREAHSHVMQRPRGRMRVTLLVNVWLSKPTGIAPLPRSIASTLSRGRNALSLCFDRKVSFAPVYLENGALSCEEAVTRGANGSTVVIEAPLGPTSLLELRAPVCERLSAGAWKTHHSFVLLYGDGFGSRISTWHAHGGGHDRAVQVARVNEGQLHLVRAQQEGDEVARSGVVREFGKDGGRGRDEEELWKAENEPPQKRKHTLEAYQGHRVRRPTAD